MELVLSSLTLLERVLQVCKAHLKNESRWHIKIKHVLCMYHIITGHPKVNDNMDQHSRAADQTSTESFIVAA